MISQPTSPQVSGIHRSVYLVSRSINPTSSLRTAMRQCSQIKSHFHADFTQGLSSIVYVAKNHNKKVQRIAAETQNNQRITNELQDRMLQLEVSSQDQILQLNTGLNALTEGQGLNTPHKEVVKANWEDGPNGRLAGIERNTSARKTNETIKINKKVLPSKIIRPAVYSSLMWPRL